MVAFPTGRAEPSALERYKSVFMEIPLYCQEVSRTPSRGPSGAGRKNRACMGEYFSISCFPPLRRCLRGGRGGPDAFSPKNRPRTKRSLFPVPSCRLGRSRKAEMRGPGGNAPDAFSAFFPRPFWSGDKKAPLQGVFFRCLFPAALLLPVRRQGRPGCFFPKKQAPHEAEPVSGAVMPPWAKPEGGNEGDRGKHPGCLFCLLPAACMAQG